MSAVVDPGPLQDSTRCLRLLSEAGDSRIIAWRRGRAVGTDEFLGDVAQVARMLPETGHAINLCDDRYLFLVGFCAAASLGHATLLPSSRAAQAIIDVRAAYADTYVLGDTRTCDSFSGTIRLPELDSGPSATAADRRLLEITESQTAVVGFTSGSTGLPKPNTKTWQNFRRGTALNAGMLAEAIGLGNSQVAHVLATVPAQHMYGMELSVLLPLFGPFSVHAGKPLFPADVAAELASLPAPRILVTTPIHLQALLRESLVLPPVAAIVSATAPLSNELAAEAETRFQAPLIEMFGSTETCVIAHRRTAERAIWTLYPGVELSTQPDGTLVSGDHLAATVQLQDIVELYPDHQFRLCGRNADQLEIAGKRASLADLTRRLQSLDGVQDAVVFQLDEESTGGVRRIAALAVAPGRSEKELLSKLRDAIDPLFLPRPLRLVDALPRNETGKLPRAALLAAIVK
jgi:acyl-coenzyme A synthetase/AMP-(fatty) acid ligase